VNPVKLAKKEKKDRKTVLFVFFFVVFMSQKIHSFAAMIVPLKGEIRGTRGNSERESVQMGFVRTVSIQRTVFFSDVFTSRKKIILAGRSPAQSPSGLSPHGSGS